MPLYRVQGFDVALENRPEGIVATVVDVPGVTATADSRSEVLSLIREQLAPFWKPSELDENAPPPLPCEAKTGGSLAAPPGWMCTSGGGAGRPQPSRTAGGP